MALSALLYAVVRFVEAYGLWLQRRWAEWFGLLMAGCMFPLNYSSLLAGHMAENRSLSRECGYRRVSLDHRIPEETKA